MIIHVTGTHLSSEKELVREKLQCEKGLQAGSSVLVSDWAGNLEREDRGVPTAETF